MLPERVGTRTTHAFGKRQPDMQQSSKYIIKALILKDANIGIDDIGANLKRIGIKVSGPCRVA